MTDLSNIQLHTLAIVPIITGTISVIASSYVLQDILRDPKKRRRTYCRLVFGMAAIDFITSLMYAFATIPMEKGATYGVFAIGNKASCTAQAFLIQMEIASPIYHFYLAWYYLLILKYRWPERKFQAYEKYLHGFALFFSLATSIALLPLDVYGEFFVWCWITNVEGHGYYQWFFFFGPLWFIIIASSLLMFQMCVHVQAEETVSRKWRNSVVDTNKLGEKKLKKMSRRVFWQAMHYELAFYMTWTIPTISQTILQLGSIEPAFGTQLANAIFTPLAGFFNFTIYIRPRYIKYMEDNKKEMWWHVLWKAIKQVVPSRKMKVEIVSVNLEDYDYDDDDDDDGNGNDCNNNNSEAIKSKLNEKKEQSKMQSPKRNENENDKNEKEESKTQEEPDYGYEDPDAARKKYGYEDPDASTNDLDDDDYGCSNKFQGESSRLQSSHAIVILDYEEDDVGIIDPAAAIEHSTRVNNKLKKMSLPKRGGKKVYKLVRKVNKGVKKRRRSLMGSVRSLVGMETPANPSESLRTEGGGGGVGDDSDRISRSARIDHTGQIITDSEIRRP